MFGVSLARNFLTPDSVDDRLFSLFVFLHIGLPLLLLLGMWVHIKRLSRPETVPARALGVGTLAALLALSVIAPVTSADPADALQVPPALALDWFYLAPHVLMYETSPQVLWAVAAVLTAIMFMLALAQIGAVPVLVCALAWLWWKDATAWFFALLVWTVVVGSLDNVLRPILIRKGADLPLLLIFAGVIGGLFAFGLLGLFVGPVILAVAYTLLDAWVAEAPQDKDVATGG